MTPTLAIPAVIPNSTHDEDKRLVEVLHYISAYARAQKEEFAAEMMQAAAVALDEYRSGLRLSTPADSTGFVLMPIPARREAA